MYALRSLPCAAALPESDDGAREGAAQDGPARVGRQPAHSDASAAVEPGATPLHALADADMPLSAMLAVQPGTRLWVYPSGCAKAEAAPAAAPLAAGARVMARHGGKAPWYAGAVAAVRADGSLDIAYDDGDQEQAVPPHLVRPAAAPAATDAPAAASADAAASQRRFASRGLNAGVSTSPRSANLASAVMRGKLLTLHTHGWVVLPVGHGGHVVDEAVLSTIRASRFEPIFNGQPAGEAPQRHQGAPARRPAPSPPPPPPLPPLRSLPIPPIPSSSPAPAPAPPSHPRLPLAPQGVHGSGPSR